VPRKTRASDRTAQTNVTWCIHSRFFNGESAAFAVYVWRCRAENLGWADVVFSLRKQLSR